MGIPKDTQNILDRKNLKCGSFVYEQQPEILNAIKRRKTEYFGHIIRNNKYYQLQVMLPGKLIVKNNTMIL